MLGRVGAALSLVLERGALGPPAVGDHERADHEEERHGDRHLPDDPPAVLAELA